MDKRIFANQGIQGLMDKTKGGNHKNMTFEDEASFGRINKPKYCWCNNKFRSCVPCPSYKGVQACFWCGGAAFTGGFFLIMPNCNTNNMSVFRYNEDIVILVCDEAVWHKSKNLEISGNIIMTHIPPYTLEMNPIE